MEVGNLWLIPVSIFCNSSLYWIQKRFILKWFCRQFLSKTVQLECDVKTTKLNGMGTTKNGYIGMTEEHSRKKLVTDGDINAVAMENIGTVIGIITALVSTIVMIETRHNIMYDRSSILIPWTHIAAWYFIVDLYNMYDAYRVRYKVTHLPVYQQCIRYIRTKWPYVLHHVLLFIFGYTVVVNDSLRGYKGDFIVATIIGEDFSNPFVNTAKVLKLLGQEKTKFYLINGILLVVIFFIVRILNIPFTLTVYAAQYHSWDIVAALYHLRVVCYMFISLQYVMQIYWFCLIVKLAIKGLSERQKAPTETFTKEMLSEKKKEE